jgi:prophage DNA circulation protein
MDPVSALAFASSIFATIDFSAKVLTGAYELHKSRSDVNEEIAHVNSIIEDLETATNAIDLGFRGTSSHEVALTKLAKKVVNLSEEISKTLQFTKIQGKRSTWRSITVSWNSTIKAGKIESLTKRVHDFRSEIILQLNLLLV